MRVIVEQAERDLVECGARGAYLREDVDAVAVLLHHPLDTADLTLDPPQPCEELALGSGVPARGVSHGIANIPIPRMGTIVAMAALLWHALRDSLLMA